MFDSPAERTLTYRLGAAYDCWGHRRIIRWGKRNAIWFIHPTGLDEPTVEPRDEPVPTREQRLAEFVASGLFTPLQLATLHGLVVERLTITEVAERHGCSRQAVVSRLLGNSRGQGGILKKARALLTSYRRHEDEDV